MPKVSVSSAEMAIPAVASRGFTGNAKTLAYFSRDKDPIHVHLHRMRRGEKLRIAGRDLTCAGYVWRGSYVAAGQGLPEGSSLIVQNGGSIEIESMEADSLLVTFKAAEPAAAPIGNNVYLLPSDRVPGFGYDNDLTPVSGRLHADASDPLSRVWLHENKLAAPDPDAPRADAEAGIHSHSEDEVIFVTAGQICLGSRLYGPGTALAIAADTMYGFSVGPEGLSFINFRAGLPKEIRFKSGHIVDEVGYWRERVGTPQPILVPAGSPQ